MPLLRKLATSQPAGGIAVGLAVGVAGGVTVAVELASASVPHPLVVTLTSTDVVVSVPVYPPTATAVLPTSVPAGNDRIWFRDGPVVQLSVAGS